MPRPSFFPNSTRKKQAELLNYIDGRKKNIRMLEINGDKPGADQERIRVQAILSKNYNKASNEGGLKDWIMNDLIVNWSSEEIPKITPKNRTDNKVINENETENLININNFIKTPSKTINELEGDTPEKLRLFVDSINMVMEHNIPVFNDNENIANLLFVGGPGSGKTHGAEGIATALSEQGHKVNYIPLTPGMIKDELYGKSQKMLESILRAADRLDGISIVCIDEIEEIATRNQHEATAAITNAFLQLTSGPNAVNNVVIIGTTNRPDMVDSAIHDRFFPVWFNEQSGEVKQKIFAKFFDNMPKGFSENDIQNFNEIPNYSVRGLKKIAWYTYTFAYREQINGNLVVKLDNIKEALAQIERDSKEIFGNDLTDNREIHNMPHTPQIYS